LKRQQWYIADLYLTNGEIVEIDMIVLVIFF